MYGFIFPLLFKIHMRIKNLSEYQHSKKKLFTTERKSSGTNLLKKQESKLVRRPFFQQNISVYTMSSNVHSSVYTSNLGAQGNPRRLSDLSFSITSQCHPPSSDVFQHGWVQACSLPLSLAVCSFPLFLTCSGVSRGLGRAVGLEWGVTHYALRHHQDRPAPPRVGKINSIMESLVPRNSSYHRARWSGLK